VVKDRIKEGNVTLHTKSLLYICTVFSIALLLFSCGDSGVGPTGGPGDERILFIRYYDSASEICSIKPDGTDFQIIASPDPESKLLGGGYHSAQWSPNKSRLVITGASIWMDAPSSLWLMDNDGDLLYQLTSDGSSPHWSSDGNEILFSRWMFTSSAGFYTINVNTLLERLALKADEFSSWGNADWSSDGKYIITQEELYWYNDEGKLTSSDREVVLLKLFNGERIQLTDNDVNDGGAHWSPDESKIVYTSGNYTTCIQIKLMNSDGSGEETLVDTLALYSSSCWSPGGDKIAYSKSEMEGYAKYARGSDIFVIDIVSGEVEQLTNFAADSIIVYVQDWK